MFAIEFFFWFSLFMVFYAYGGYPIILRVMVFFKSDTGGLMQPRPSHGHQPTVSLIISAYNEESVIEAKILNSLSLDYPKDLIEIVVISDGSSDRTNEIVSLYAGKRVVLRHYKGRIGKTACLNMAIPLAKGEIIVFSDANSQYDRNSLRDMVRHFYDPKIGFVTGWTKYIFEKDREGTGSLGLYARLELLTKTYESMINSCVGADGAIFAIRKELYRPLMPHDINDFVIPLTIIQQGFRGILEEKALCFETTAGSAEGEFHRQVRITNRTIRAIMNNRSLLNPRKFGIFSFELSSHKLCRLLVPLFLIVLFVSGLLLSGHSSFFFIIFSGQLFFYISAGFAKHGDNVSFLSKLVAPAHTFVVVNFAIFIAWIKYFQGETYTIWSPTQR
jgi:cellulose synthase/poly-beta-1,6-N-acetylglucosamine synthase-like glycosyltransferase